MDEGVVHWFGHVKRMLGMLRGSIEESVLVRRMVHDRSE